MPLSVVSSFASAVLMLTLASDPTVADTVVAWPEDLADVWPGFSAASAGEAAKVSAATITAARLHCACMCVLRSRERVTAMLASVTIQRGELWSVNVQCFRHRRGRRRYSWPGPPRRAR